MSVFRKAVWDQLKNKTIQDIARALERDGWIKEISRGATQGYRHPEAKAEHNRVVLHIHPKATKSPRILKGLLDTIGWTEADLIRLGLVKGSRTKRK